MQNYYTDVNFTKHLAKPPEEDQPAALAHYTKIFANPLCTRRARRNQRRAIGGEASELDLCSEN
ncbi:MAG TPA: hypothetical protein VMC78_19540 [Mycobacterium sp.]|nr:hypothetical protein [Mycobacterium sp.]